MNLRAVLRQLYTKSGLKNYKKASELEKLQHLANKYMWSDVEIHRTLNKAGVIIEPARFYSQLPTVDDIENSFEYQPDVQKSGPYFDPTLFDSEHIRSFMERTVSYAAEFDPPIEGNAKNPSGFFWKNPAFSYSDAMSYWCQIREKKPNKVVEIGSGFSTLVARDALAKNGKGELVCIEPYPMDWMAKSIPEMRLIKEPIQALSIDDLNNELGDGDILFIDSTHTVKIGSDCLWIYLKLLPAIAHSIHVHVHDVFLPFAQPMKSALQEHVHWVEAYLLLAYLTDNPRVKVEFGSMFAARFLTLETKRFMHERWPGSGGSFWFAQQPRT